MVDFEGYCVKCKAKVNVTGGHETTTKKGKPMYKGSCPNCGTTVCRFISK